MSALAVPARDAEPTSHRQILEALSGLLLVLFVALLSSTVVSNALPQIISELRGSQSQYTWVVTATLLAATATTPDLGQAGRPVQQEAADPGRDRDLHGRLGDRRARHNAAELIAGGRSRASASAGCRRWCRSRSRR